MTDRIQKLLAFLKDTPNDCFLNHALALEYVKISDEPNAKLHFENNLNHAPTYIATYYHLAKLYVRIGERGKAISLYQTGMEQAKAAKDNHSYNELQAEYEDLID